jgi:hypothetical protein
LHLVEHERPPLGSHLDGAAEDRGMFVDAFLPGDEADLLGAELGSSRR